MRRSAVIFLTLLYCLSTSGVIGSNFYCCGRLQNTRLFSYYHPKSADMPESTMPGCCDTKLVFSKVITTHLLTPQVKANRTDNPMHLQYAPMVLPYFESSAVISTALVLTNPPPLLNKEPVYLNNCVFRI